LYLCAYNDNFRSYAIGYIENDENELDKFMRNMLYKVMPKVNYNKYSILYNDEELSDVTLVIMDDKQKININAHRLILAVESRYFKTLLMNRIWPNKQIVEIKVDDVNTCIEIIRYIYYGSIVIDRIKSVKMLKNMADMFLIDDLMNIINKIN